ncbi:hypothetical protein [Deinococcus aestuarii]|uniref:hypothetical protein n=1 Tax=Deinococcus aestuarii TaxID=2774531 RepID=UPI001C0D0C17|nr:hypothetical protein [Deinococcus aestuarii]
MREREAAAFLSGVVQPTQLLILKRNSASVLELRKRLLEVLQQVQGLPDDWSWSDDFEPRSFYRDFRARISDSWPELGFYDGETEQGFTHDVSTHIGDAADDLADIAVEFESALRLAGQDPLGAVSLLKFTAQTHWDEHVEGVARHLLWLSGAREAYPS